MERFRNSKKPILWVSGKKNIPPRPENPERFDKDDYRHWYDREYAGWNVAKENIPLSPSNGPKGKKIICLLPGRHPYNTAYESGMERAAEAFGIEIEIRYSGWDEEEQYLHVRRAVRERPDMIVLVPENSGSSTQWYREINSAGIPVIASNLMPEEEGFKYILSWTGPDDWGQFRKLAKVFAEKMNYRGGYCIVTHIPGCSAYYARTWGMITELRRIAPDMKLLAMQSTSLDTEMTYLAVKSWIEQFGDGLKGIVSADDNLVQMGVNRALSEKERDDVVRVANGSTRTGIRMLKEGKLDAITFQSAELDGTLPVQVAVDWFNGLIVPPLKYLPVHILTRENIDEFMFDLNAPGEIDLDSLYRMIIECNSGEVRSFFDSLFLQFSSMGVLTVEYFNGFAIELISNLINIVKSSDLPEKSVIGDYETIFKKLFNQPAMELTLSWLKEVALDIVEGIREKRDKPQTLIQQIVEYVNREYNKPLSLKTISNTFNISAAYLGKLFKEETGRSFPSYINKLRIEKAKVLLKSTGKKANRIAVEVGYSDPNYFYNTFKKYTGMSPSEYLEKN